VKLSFLDINVKHSFRVLNEITDFDICKSCICCG
jgi:hypothetical protein